MSVKTKDEILASIRERFAEDTSDETISFIEDISDTFSDLETRANGDGVDWKAKAKEIDDNWRAKYKERFFSSGNDEQESEPDPDPAFQEQKAMKFEDLFTEKR